MSRITEDLERGEAFAWSSLRPVFDHAIVCARECEYIAAQASNLAQTHVSPAYPPIVELLAQAGKQIEVAEPKVRPLQPGDWFLSGSDKYGYTPYWIDDSGHLVFQVNGVLQRSVVPPEKIGADRWRVRGGVQVKQP